ncbi:hypothetical protein VE01_02529 [Pseudogymnoascus verrucosus]|uniref:Thioredoxin domain-containing protein n=1 Tax=Pseudogymnoascus verrucosus TaxID=342668 RepID=A0A1B8GU71_9PEZI|nr:uncharacterized protein VE01_02529 [Pseudogymnoascus verrucosus]OBT99376.1 hypothetical protein VE01_02529 [Pseudogymnoascus verrucosus]
MAIRLPSTTPTVRVCIRSIRQFSSSAPHSSKNRIYTPIRHPAALHETILLSTSSRTPLITYWSAGYCPPCKVISPILHQIISSDSPPCPADPGNKVGFVEVEFDAPENMGSSLGMDFIISSLPTLVVFDRGEVVDRETDVKNMSNEQWLREWIERQARRHGEGTGGGGTGTGLFGGLFGKL